MKVAFLPPEHPFSELTKNTAVEILEINSKAETATVQSILSRFDKNCKTTTEVNLKDLSY